MTNPKPRPEGIPPKPPMGKLAVSVTAIVKDHLARPLADLLAQAAKGGNVDPLIAETLIWDTIAAYAKARSDTLWERLEEHLPERDEITQGESVIKDTRLFAVTANKTKPVAKFDVDTMAKEMKKQFKVPEPMTKDIYNKSKVDGSSRITYNILEK